MKLFISPSFRSEDRGDGGIRRVVEAQRKLLPTMGVEVVDIPEQADVIAVHAGNYLNSGTKPVVAHCHGLYWDEYQWENWHYALNKDVIGSMHKADAVTATAEWVANVLRRGMWLDPTVVYHGIDVDEWQPGENLGYVLWNKTRVDPVCDPEPLSKLAQLAPNTNFVSTYGAKLPNIRLTGTVSYAEAKPLVQNAGVYLCTSRETFGIGTLEAMASGVPILGWQWGGQAEFIKNGVNGYLARPGNYDDLLYGLNYCIANRDSLGRAARDTARQFTWESSISAYVPVYQRVLDRLPTVVVSVVIPCHNLSRFLKRAIDSVLKNNFLGEYEIIVVDDASSNDEAAAIKAMVAEYRKNNIRLIRNETNQYLAETLNIGIAAAHGEYILPLDADNEIGGNTLAVLSDHLDKHRDTDIAYGRMEVVEADGKRWISDWPTDFRFERQMLHHNQCPSTSMYRRTVWERSGGYRRRCRTAEDADFWTRVTSLGFSPHKVTDAITLIYYNRNDSMSHVEKDWDWTAWYPWSRDDTLVPFGAVQNEKPKVVVPEPTLVSVIIPVGPGHERLVIDAIDSLVAQTFVKWEAIVVNDTGEPLPWIHPFARVINTSGRIGAGAARNIGIRASRASCFVLLDADDYLHPTALDGFFEAYRKHGGYVYSDWFQSEGSVAHETNEWSCASVLDQMGHSVTAIYPKKAWEEVGGFDEQLDAWEDWDFIIRLNATGYCGTRIPKPLFYYRYKTGARRELAANDKPTYIAAIKKRWQEYYDGRKQLMACGGCGKGGGAKLPTQMQAATNGSVQAPVAEQASFNDMTLLEYTSPEKSSRVFKGRVTGQQYKFGNNANHKIRYVYNADVAYFIELGVFKRFVPKVAEVNEPILVAAGPPAKS